MSACVQTSSLQGTPQTTYPPACGFNPFEFDSTQLGNGICVILLSFVTHERAPEKYSGKAYKSAWLIDWLHEPRHIFVFLLVAMARSCCTCRLPRIGCVCMSKRKTSQVPPMAREAVPKSHAFRFTNPGSRWFDYHLRTPCFFFFPLSYSSSASVGPSRKAWTVASSYDRKSCKNCTMRSLTVSFQRPDSHKATRQPVG